MRRRDARRYIAAFTLIEIIFAFVIIAILVALVTIASQRARKSASMAVSANNLRQIAVGGVAYLGDNNQTFWKYAESTAAPQGTRWWFGFESQSSLSAGEGNRSFDPREGPLGSYVPKGMMVDPAFAFTGKPFKPKYASGYFSIGYNLFLAGHTPGTGTGSGAWDPRPRFQPSPIRFSQLHRPDQIVMFATSAQVNDFQSPANADNPMIEEFYGLDDSEVTLHGRFNGNVMVAYATGNVGFLPIDPLTIDKRAPEAKVGRFAPVGDTKYLVDSEE